MTVCVETLDALAGSAAAIVLDQWGVLHDGSVPYPGAPEALRRLKAAGLRLGVLSNSGKRSSPNLERIAAMGFDPALFDCVMTSGEALWQDVAAGRVPDRAFLPVTRAPGDAVEWSKGLPIRLTTRIDEAEAVLLMGLPDEDGLADWKPMLDAAFAAGLPIYCSNPDRAGPRAGGTLVVSPGTLAHNYAERGGHVIFYGKPHRPVFAAVERALDLPPSRLVMVGDSLEHDIAGAHGAGWRTVFVRGGLAAVAFAGAQDILSVLASLADREAAPMPDYTIPSLR